MLLGRAHEYETQYSAGLDEESLTVRGADKGSINSLSFCGVRLSHEESETVSPQQIPHRQETPVLNDKCNVARSVFGFETSCGGETGFFVLHPFPDKVWAGHDAEIAAFSSDQISQRNAV